jgi:hypothetical protein
LQIIADSLFFRPNTPFPIVKRGGINWTPYQVRHFNFDY